LYSAVSVLLVTLLEDAACSRLQRGPGRRQICETDRMGLERGIADPLLEAKLGRQSKFAGLHSWKKK
jgi:hypothetical protein